jgi:uncharacterized protein involved in exopolysaccharide biosynthesis
MNDATAGKSSPSLDGADSNEFVSYATRIWRARGFILKAVVAGAVASVILAYALPKRYESTTRLMPPANRSSQASSLLANLGQGPLAAAGSNALGLQSPSALYEQVLESRTVLDYLIDKYDLRKVYRVSTYKDARSRLGDNTQIADDRKSGVITVIVEARSPQLAQQLARGYVDELNSLMVELDTSAAHRERVFLEDRLKGVDEDLKNYSAQLGKFTSKNTVVAGEEQSKAIFTAAETLRGQAIVAKADLVALQKVYGPDNERVRAAQAKVDELQHQLAQMRGTDQPGGDSMDGFPSIRALPMLGAQYSDLYRQMTVEEAVFENLTKQYEMAKVEEARDLPTVRVLDDADLPEVKSWPRRTLIVLAGTFWALLISCTYVLLRAWWLGADSPWRRFAGEVASNAAADVARVPGFGKIAEPNQQHNS